MLVIKQKIHTHLIIINLYIAIQNTRLRSRGVGVMEVESEKWSRSHGVGEVESEKWSRSLFG